jgi:hypothetical protein
MSEGLSTSEVGTGTQAQPVFADDLLRGADAIAEFLYGDKKFRRKVYHLASTTKLPVFKLGSMICARKSVLLKWIAAQEDRHGG